MKLRAWISTCATVAASGGALWGQTPMPVAAPSGAPAALAAQTSVIHPANEKPIFTMRTAGQPDRAVRVIKLNEGDPEAMADVQDVQSGRQFSMPGKVVRAMLGGTKPTMPAPATAAPQAVPPTVTAAPVSTPVFQPARIASSISERPGTVPVREIPTVTAVATIVPGTPAPQVGVPRIEPVPEEEKARMATAIQPPVKQPTVTEVPEPMPLVVPQTVEVIPTPVPEPVKVPAPEVVPIAKLVPPAPAVAPMPTTPTATAAVPIVAPAPAPRPAAVPVAQKPAPAPTPQFGTPLQTPQPASTSMKAVPVQTWQPIRDAGTPSNNSLWQALPAPTEAPKPAAAPQAMAQPVEAKPTTTVTTQCQFDQPTPCTECSVEPQVKVERTAMKCNSVSRMEATVREACQGFIYDLCTSAKPSDREEAATKLVEGKFAQRPEVKAAILKAAVGDPAPSVRAHCIECLMKLGYNELGFRAHLQDASEHGAKIVQTAARTALANLPSQ